MTAARTVLALVVLSTCSSVVTAQPADRTWKLATGPVVVSAPEPIAESTDGPVSAERRDALAAIAADPDAAIRGIVERWRPTIDARPGTRGWDNEMVGYLRAVAPDKLLEARNSASYEEMTAKLFGRWTGPAVKEMSPGQNVLGSMSGDLVYTPVVPCRIVDTRYAIGKIGPNNSRSFSVNLADNTAQGGFAGSCGIPTTVEVAAVAVNVTSTLQTGVGSLRVYPNGAALPSASLLNYQSGVNLANAAVVTTGVGLGDDIVVYSYNSATDVVVDLMGYFAAPVASPTENIKVSSSISLGSYFYGSLQSPTCPAGYTLSGGGGGFTASDPYATVMFVHAYGSSGGPITNYNCGGANGGDVANNLACASLCTRVPGRSN